MIYAFKLPVQGRISLYSSKINEAKDLLEVQARKDEVNV